MRYPFSPEMEYRISQVPESRPGKDWSVYEKLSKKLVLFIVAKRMYMQTRWGISATGGRSVAGAAQQRRFFSWAFPDRDRNSTEFSNEKLRQNVTAEAFSGK